MYSKLNIKNIVKGHKDTLGVNNKLEFIILPLILSLVLILIKVPDSDVKNIFSICLSILTGLYLNVLVLLISSISSDDSSIPINQKK